MIGVSLAIDDSTLGGRLSSADERFRVHHEPVGEDGVGQRQRAGKAVAREQPLRADAGSRAPALVDPPLEDNLASIRKTRTDDFGQMRDDEQRLGRRRAEP